MFPIMMWLFGCTASEKVVDLIDTDFDTADPYDDVADCDNSGLSTVELSTPIALGSFEVFVDDSVFEITNSGASLFSGQENWLTVTLSERDVEEFQGSFGIEYTEKVECSTPVVSTVQSSDNTMLIEGGFSDEGCELITFTVQICPNTAQRLFFDIEIQTPEADEHDEYRIGIHQASVEQEKFFGLGEQFPHDQLNLKGRTITVISEEGGVGRGHPEVTPLIDRFSNGSGGDESSTYFAMPFYMTDFSTGLFLHNTELSEFSFQEEQTSVIVDSTNVQGEFVIGESPLNVLTTFTEYAGRMPAPPDWVDNGAIVALARPLDEGRGYVDDLLNHEVQIAGVWNQTWSGVNRTFIGEQVLWNWYGTYDHPDWSTGSMGSTRWMRSYACELYVLDVTGHEVIQVEISIGKA